MSSLDQSLFSSLIRFSSEGNDTELSKLFASNTLSQYDIDAGFRACIDNFKNRNEKYVNCLKIFLKQIPDINYKNSKLNNTTILMHCIEKEQEIPIDMIISCYNGEIKVNIEDDKGENVLVKLLKSDIDEQSQSEFFGMLMSNKVDLNAKNKNGESIMTIIEKDNKVLIKEEIKNYIKESTFEIEKYVDMFNKGEYSDILEVIKRFEEKESLINQNLQFEFNRNITEMRLVIKSINEKKKTNEYHYVASFTLNGNIIDEYQFNIAHLLYKTNVNMILPKKAILLLNKMILYYQLDDFANVTKLKREIEQCDEVYKDKFIFFYVKSIYLEMLIEREKLTEAKKEVKQLEEEFDIKEHECYVNKEVYKDFFRKNMIFDIDNEKEVKLIFQLMKIMIMIQEKDESDINMSNEEMMLTSQRIKNAVSQINSLDITEYNTSKLLFLYYSFLNIHLIYYSSHFSQNKINLKLGKLLNFKTNSVELNLNFEEDEDTKIYYYNSYGILNLKNENYSLASFYFLRCIHLIKRKTPLQLIKHFHLYPKIAFNLALSYFFLKKYQQCSNLLRFILQKKNSFISNSRYVFYRLALSELEQWKSINKSKKVLCLINEEVALLFKKVLLMSKIKDSVYYSAFLNLIFCLITNRQYTEAIFYIDSRKEKCINKEIENVIENYHIQCYLFIGKVIKANEIAENVLLSDNTYRMILHCRDL